MALASLLRHVLARAGLAQRRCVACLQPFTPAPSALPLCSTCIALLPPRKGGFCPHCGEIVSALQAPDSLPIVPCGACLRSPPPWRQFRFYGVFDSLLRDILHRAKYQGDTAALDLSGRLLLHACLPLNPPDAIIPMPLHPLRLQHRGFNQCLEMARPLARHWRVPIRHAWLLRRRHTPPQTGLNREERLRNLNAAFLASPLVASQHILLIDDTATTGTSLRRATEALLAAGAASVNVAVIARAMRHARGVGVSVGGN